MMLMVITVAKVFFVLTYRNKSYLKAIFEALKKQKPQLGKDMTPMKTAPARAPIA